MTTERTLTLGIQALRVAAIIGIHPHERLNPQPLEISVTVEARLKKLSDKIDDTVDYSRFRSLILAEVAKAPNLIEWLGESILDALLAVDPRILNATVEIQKPAAVPDAAFAFTRLTKTRPHAKP